MSQRQSIRFLSLGSAVDHRFGECNKKVCNKSDPNGSFEDEFPATWVITGLTLGFLSPFGLES